LDEYGLRALLEEVSADELPPVRVSAELAASTGRRRLRWRRVYLPGVAPLAAAVAVAVIVGLLSATGADLHQPDTGPAPAAPLRAVPTRFSPLVPYASFGWLPPGFTTGGLGNQRMLNTAYQTQTASGPRGRELSLAVYAGPCQFTGTYVPSTPHRRMSFPHGLTCPYSPPLPLRGPAAPVNGHPAYWGGETQLALVWEYGKNAWAELTPGGEPASWTGRTSLGGRTVYPSAATAAMLDKVAARIRYGIHPSVRYGFTVSGVPRSWLAPGQVTLDDVASIGSTLANVGWQAGPAADRWAMDISVAPARLSTKLCGFGPGRYSHLGLDGVRAAVSNWNYGGHVYREELCAKDVRGLQVHIVVELGYQDDLVRLLPAGQVWDLQTLVQHLHLLGPDLARWVTSPTG
jgi:hypothetical protein